MTSRYNRFTIKRRRNSGSVLLLTFILALFLLSSFVLGSWIFKYNALQSKQQAATEAAALASAQELSRIVVEDPHFGFVSLSEQNSGKRTVSPAGEPMPVRGINTILSNIRQTRIIAKQLASTSLMDLTEKEFDCAKSAQNLLKKAFIEAAQDGPKRLALDVNGKPVDLYQKAKQVYEHCSQQANLNDTQFQISIGQLTGGGPTISAAPMPESLGLTQKWQLFGLNYMSCVKIPCHGLDFVFASVSSQATLADAASFQEVGKDQLGSVLRLSVNHKIDNINSIGASACAIPPAYRVAVNNATLMVALPTGIGQEATSFSNILRSDFSGGRPQYRTSVNGDFPIDQSCVMLGASGADDFGGAIGQVVYDWLRSSNPNSPNTLKSIMDIFDAPMVTVAERDVFKSYYLAFYFDRDAKLHRHLFCRNPFYKEFVSESQDSGSNTVMFKSAPTAVSYIDNVKNIGTENSGKHGGQLIGISTIDGPSILATNLEDEQAYQRTMYYNTVLPPSDSLPETLSLAGELQFLSESNTNFGADQ
jgi:hypothetical protein